MRAAAVKILLQRLSAGRLGRCPDHWCVPDVLECPRCSTKLHDALRALRSQDERGTVPRIPRGSMERR